MKISDRFREFMRDIGVKLAIRRADRYLKKHPARLPPKTSQHECDQPKQTVVNPAQPPYYPYCAKCEEAEKLAAVQRILANWEPEKKPMKLVG